MLAKWQIATSAPKCYPCQIPPAPPPAPAKLRALMAPIQEAGFTEMTLSKVQVCFDALYERADVKQRVAITGFCFGGGYSYNLAIHEPRLSAALPFYGHVTSDVEELKQIACPVLAFYGETDEGLMKDLPELRKAMTSAGVDYQAQVYPDCGHAFFNDANPYAYNESAARDAWQKSLDFLNKHMAL